MRVAAFNVENLFDRARVFGDDGEGLEGEVLDAHAELNRLFEQAVYTDDDKARMLELIEALGMLRRDEGRFVRIRKIRGQLISRPRTRPTFIKANGRDDWIGWCELKTAPVDEVAMMNTARMIRDARADVLAVVEAESRPVLKEFHDRVLSEVGVAPGQGYRHIMVIDGNDGRGIDVGLATREGFPIGTVRSHVDDLKEDGFPIFSRDCPEYEVTTALGNRLILLPNHFKSKFGGNDPSSRAKRLAQAEAVAGYYNRLLCEGFENIIVLGDLNDTPDSEELAPLLQDTDLKDISEHERFTAFEFNANNGHRGIGTHGLGNDSDKIDYLLLSPALFGKVTLAGMERRGLWPGSRPPRWEVYPELEKKHHRASDHHLLWADIDI
ncbi:MAG: endonuclease/exonuclease/phosphatase family protein [Pseudomonadota bacterium]